MNKIKVLNPRNCVSVMGDSHFRYSAVVWKCLFYFYITFLYVTFRLVNRPYVIIIQVYDVCFTVFDWGGLVNVSILTSSVKMRRGMCLGMFCPLLVCSSFINRCPATVHINHCGKINVNHDMLYPIPTCGRSQSWLCFCSLWYLIQLH